MATLTKTFTFDNDTEGYVATPASGTTMNWTVTPVPSLQARRTGKSLPQATSYWEWTGTWEQLGIEPGSTVTAIQLVAGWTRVTEYATGASSRVGPYELRNSTGTTLVGTLWAGRTFTAADAGIAIPSQTAVSVGSTYQPSNTTIKLRLADALATGSSNSAAVTALDDSVSLTVTYTPPPAPAAITNLSAAVVDARTINLTWTPTVNTATQTLERSTDGTNYSTVSAGLTASSNSYTDTNANGVIPNTQYWYRIISANGSGSATSNVVTATTPADTPLAPVLTGVNGNGQVDLSWTQRLSADGYYVYRNNVLYDTIVGNGTFAKTYISLTNGTSYTWEVSAYNSFGEGGRSNQVALAPSAIQTIIVNPSVFYPGTSPTSGAFSDVDEGVDNFDGQLMSNTAGAAVSYWTFTFPKPANSTLTGQQTFRIRALKTGTNNPAVTLGWSTTQAATSFTNSTSLSITSTTGAVYTHSWDADAQAQPSTIWGKIAVDSQSGNSSNYSTFSLDAIDMVQQVTLPPPSAPSSPTVIVAKSVPSTTLSITVTQSPVYPTPSLSLYRGTSANAIDTFVVALNSDATSQNYVDTGLTTGQTYYYKVVSTNAYGTVESNVDSATPSVYFVENTFNNGVHGQFLTVENSSTSGDSFTFQSNNDQWIYDSDGYNQSMAVWYGSGTSAQVVGWTPPGGLTAGYMRWYMKFSGFWNTNLLWGRFLGAGFYLNTDGTMMAGSGGTSTSPVPLHQWIRLEWYVEQGVTSELRVFHDPTSTTPTDTVIFPSPPTGNNYMAIGPRVAATSGYPKVLLDSISAAESAYGWIGPVAPPTGYTSADSPSLSFIESSEVVTLTDEKSSSETPTISFTENRQFSTVIVSSTDSTTISLTENRSFGTISVTGTDSSNMSVGEARVFGTITVAATETATVQIVEGSPTTTTLYIVTAVDSTTLTATESGSLMGNYIIFTPKTYLRITTV